MRCRPFGCSLLDLKPYQTKGDKSARPTGGVKDRYATASPGMGYVFFVVAPGKNAPDSGSFIAINYRDTQHRKGDGYPVRRNYIRKG